MTSEVTKGGLPTWAKWLIGIAVAGIVVFITGIIVVMWSFSQMFKQDAASVGKLARDVAEFSTPLPEGYHFKMGVDVPVVGIKMVGVEHDPDKQMVLITSYPTSEKVTAEEFVEKVADKGVMTPGQAQNGRIEEIKAKGTETVGGESMPYLVGTMTDKTGAKVEGMLGCVISKAKGKTVLILGLQQGDGAFDLDVTRKLLKSIKSF